jgi:hypothetical protein
VEVPPAPRHRAPGAGRRAAGELSFESRDGWAHIFADLNGDDGTNMSVVAVIPYVQASDFIV